MRWLLILLATTLCCAAITAVCLVNYPALSGGGRGPPFYIPCALALGLLLASAPLLWALALALPGPHSLAALRGHAALYSVLLAITYLVNSPGHSSPAEAFAAAIWFILVLILGIEALVGALAWIRMWRWSPGEKALPFVYVGLTTALLGGGFCGVLIWSTMLPHRVITAAETAAGDRPYCIDVEKGPARSAGDLSGLRMRATNDRGWIWNFHALLVIGEAADRRYMNWSYRTGRFEPVSDSAREGLHLDREARCTPTLHFARGWL